MVHVMDLISKLDRGNPIVQNRVSMMQHSFISKGMTPDVALKSAYQSLDFSIMKQSMVLSYMDVFLYIGILFLICVPFILLIKGNRNKKAAVSGATH